MAQPRFSAALVLVASASLVAAGIENLIPCKIRFAHMHEMFSVDVDSPNGRSDAIHSGVAPVPTRTMPRLFTPVVSVARSTPNCIAR
ncbi:MAG: hypothetical protein OEW53_04005, partial [Actinomycetota bacterium]|nr:hypothetical protein [Actinomycetota bacterium]